ncbi:MAG: PKD domain-containing protein [Candidatus Eisenbacteria bacterium]|nr:PKD domain-containing protein [Candidatus Eisenbacteria bacterium]
MRAYGLRIGLAVILPALVGGLACDDDGSTTPSNQAPEIVALQAEPPVVVPGGEMTLTCSAEDPEAEDLEFAWSAATGVLSGEGATVTWTAPPEEGTHLVSVTVEDARGGVARDTLGADVFGGTLLLETRDGLTAVRFDGTQFVLHETTGSVEVLDTRIFTKSGSNVTELGHDGSVLERIDCTNDEIYGHEFAMLPDAGYVLISNSDDVIHFVAPDGTFLETVAMPDSSPESLQNADGVLAEGRLIVSETGTRKLIAVDPDTHEATIFREEDPGGGWLGAIDYADGRYYLCQSMDVHSFVEGGATETLGTVPDGNITGVKAVGSYLYLVINHEGTLRRMHRETGEVELMIEELDYPQDVEYLPVALEE